MVEKIFNIQGLPPDLWPRRPIVRGPMREANEGYTGSEAPDEAWRRIPPEYSGYFTLLGRAFHGERRTVGPTPTKIIDSSYAAPYIILNPSLSTGLTTSFTIASGTFLVTTNTQASPIGVGNYLNMHFHLQVSAVVGTWDIMAQTRDPITSVWTDSQVIFSGITAPGNFYAFVGGFGIVTDFAVNIIETVAGSIALNLTGTLKDGLSGSAAGLAQTIYIGANEGVSIVSGFPILEGQQYPFILGEGVEVWAVSATSVEVAIFKMQ